jgi:hypothetical protein
MAGNTDHALVALLLFASPATRDLEFNFEVVRSHSRTPCPNCSRPVLGEGAALTRNHGWPRPRASQRLRDQIGHRYERKGQDWHRTSAWPAPTQNEARVGHF